MQQNSEVPCASDLLQRALKISISFHDSLFEPLTHSLSPSLSVLTSTAAPKKNGGRRGGQKHNSPEKKFPDSVVGFYPLASPASTFLCSSQFCTRRVWPYLVS